MKNFFLPLFPTFTKLSVLGVVLYVNSNLQAALPAASDQFLQSLSRGSAGLAEPGEGHTIEFLERFQSNPWISEFNNSIINGTDVPAALREKGQMMLDQVETLDLRCAGTPNGPAQEACAQQRDAAIAQIEKMVADNNPDVEILLTEAAKAAGDFSAEFDPSNLVQQFDGLFSQAANLKDMLGSMGSLPQTPTKEALQTPLPAGPTNNITQQLNLGDNLEHKRLAVAEMLPISPEQSEGFFDKIQNFWQQIKPGVGNALILQAVAQSPFSTLGQSGQSQLRVISTNRSTDAFAEASKSINDQRDRLVTQFNDIRGQGLSAINERMAQNMEVLNNITQQQDQTLQSIQHLCQSQRANVPCWENGNEIPFDLLALLMGMNGGGGGESSIDAPELEPYTAWLHCPLPNQPFIITSEGQTSTGLFLDEKSRLILTLASALPSPLHPEGCIVGLPSEEGLQYLTVTVKPDVSTNENKVEADLVLLEIQQVHQELGKDLADPDMAYDDFINEYWPAYQAAACDSDPVFRIGDELNLLGFEPLETESEGPEEVVILNGLANFVAEENGATRFTSNGEESFRGGLVARAETGCFKGLAQIEIDVEEESNDQSLIPMTVINAWLASQGIALPEPKNQIGDR